MAFQMLLRDHPDLELDLVFTGALEESAQQVRAQVKAMGLEKRVHFLGYLSDREFAAVLAACKMIVFPSLYEGFGIPVVEAMSIGKPVICSNVTSLPEVAGDAALFFDPHKPEEIRAALERLLKDPELEKNLIHKGFLQAAKFSQDGMMREYLKIFSELGNRYRRARESVQGIFADGWTGETIRIRYGASLSNRASELLLEAPPFLPAKTVRIRVESETPSPNRWTIERGRRSSIRIPLPHQGGEIELSIHPSFIPLEHGFPGDSRKLGCLCHSCDLVDDKRGRRVLFRSPLPLASPNQPAQAG